MQNCAAQRFQHRLLLSVITVLLVGACAPALAPGGASGPAEIARLEAISAQEPAHVAHLVRLGAAYRAAGRLDDARQTLERASQLKPGDGGVALYLGITYEDLGELTAARRLYESYIATGSSNQVKNALRRRMPNLRRRELQAAIAHALATEAELPATPDPRTVAVFPFAITSADESLRPLGRAFAELLVTDLGITGRVRVLERTQVQMLLDEQQLGQTRYVEPATAARSGRLLGAGRIVQGQVDGDVARLRLDAAVVNAGTGTSGRLDRLNTEGALAELFDIQKRITLMVHDELQIELTAAERERLGVHRTRNIQALLAFGLGLEAEDEGRYADAAAHFGEAAALDPGFGLATAHAERATQMALTIPTTAELARLGAGDALLSDFGEIDALASIQNMIVPQGPNRDPFTEAFGNEGFSSIHSILRLIIRRPQ